MQMSNVKILKKPRTIYIETTNLCNAKCPMCPHEKITREKGVMSWSLFEKIVNDCKELDLEETTIYLHKEGEPLLDNKIFERIKYIKKQLPKLKEVVLNTNAMLLNEDKAKELIDSKIDKVFFSVDGATRKSYEKLRLGLDYETVVKNLQYFLNLKKQTKSKIHTVMQMLVYKENRHEVSMYNELWKDLADEIFIKEMHNYLDAGMSQLTTQKSKEQLRICTDPYDMMVVYCNGEVGICCWDYDNFAKVGDVRNSSIVEVFNNSHYENIRTKMKNFEANGLNPCNRCLRVFGQDQISGYSSTEKRIIK